MSDTHLTAKSGAILRARFPELWFALDTTYYRGAPWTMTATDGSNEAGYLLQGAQRAQAKFIQIHGHRPHTWDSIDRAFANEVRYQFNRGTVFQRPAAGLSACLTNLAIERREKFDPNNAVRRKKHAGQNANERNAITSNRRGHAPSENGVPMLQNHVTAAGETSADRRARAERATQGRCTPGTSLFSVPTHGYGY